MDDENDRKRKRIAETDEDLYRPSTSRGIVHLDFERSVYKPEEHDYSTTSSKRPKECLSNENDKILDGWDYDDDDDDDHPYSESVANAGTVEIHELIDAYSAFDPACIVPSPNNTNITIFYDFMNSMTIEMLTLFAQLFDINIVSNIDNATVLIVKTFEENAFYRSENTGHAIIKHIPIVTLKWVVECLKVNTLVDFDFFMPVDISDIPSPSISWNVGKGYIETKFDWTKHFIIYLHSSVKDECERSWARKLEFVIADDLEDFKKGGFELRIVLVDCSKVRYGISIPGKESVLDWVRNYQALTVDVKWLRECLFQYKFIELLPIFVPVPIPKNLAYISGLDKYYKTSNED